MTANITDEKAISELNEWRDIVSSIPTDPPVKSLNDEVFGRAVGAIETLAQLRTLWAKHQATCSNEDAIDLPGIERAITNLLEVKP